MHVRIITADESELVAPWFANMDWPSPPVDGAIDTSCLAVEDEKGLISCIHLYFTGTAYLHLDWFAENPEVDSLSKRQEALKVMMQAIEQIASKDPKLSAVIFYSKDRALESHMKDLGYWVKKGYTQFSKIVRGDED